MKNILLFDCIPVSLYTDTTAYISTVRTGAPGHWLACIVEKSGLEHSLASALGMSLAQMSEACRSEVLGSRVTEAVLDIAKLLTVCEETWGTRDQAIQWLISPLPALAGASPESLMDTFKGRRWVTQTLHKIERGEFS